MNKLPVFFFASLLILLSLETQAQISLIPRAGVTFSNIAFDDEIWEDRKIVTGFTTGVGLNYSLTGDNFLSIQPEVVYTQKGFAAKGSFLTVNYEGTYRLNYIELPVLLKFNFGTEIIHAYINIGPSIGYLLNGRVKGTRNSAGSVSTSINESIELTETPDRINITELDANRVEISGNAGVGIGYHVSEKVTLLLDVRYTLGVTDFDKNQESKNRVITLSAGLQIPF